MNDIVMENSEVSQKMIMSEGKISINYLLEQSLIPGKINPADYAQNTSEKNSTKTSWIWKYFKLLDKGEKHTEKPVTLCQVTNCKKEYVYLSGSTSSMLRHIKEEHREIFDNHKNTKFGSDGKIQTTLSNFKISKLTKNESDNISIALVKWLSVNSVPFNVIDNDEFKQFCNLLNTGYLVPANSTLKENFLDRLYCETKEKLSKELAGLDRFSISCDAWTYNNAENYLCINIDYISNFNIKHATLKTCKISDDHTPENIASKIMKSLSDFKLNITNLENCFAVTDGGHDMIAASEILNLKHIPDICHILDNTVKASIKNSDPSIAFTILKAKRLVRYVKRSYKATFALKRCHNILNTKFFKLKQTVDTRWNSIYLMINSLLLNKRQMIDITNDHSDKKLQKKLKTYMLNDNDWQIIEYLKPLLFVFYERTRYLSKRSSRASAIIPTQIIINDTIQVVNNPITSTEIFASILKNIFNEKMEKYNKCESILLLMSRLDPQFKNFDFGNMLNELSDNLTREEYLSKKTAFSTSNNNFNYSSNDEFSKYMRPIRKQTETRELDDYVNADGIGLKKKEDESEDPDIMNWWK